MKFSGRNLADSFRAAWEYAVFHFIVGLGPVCLVPALLGHGELAPFVLIHNVVCVALVLPGTMLLNLYGGSLLGPACSDASGRRWNAAIFSVVLTWIGYLGIAALGICPPDLLVRSVGASAAWGCHLFGWVILASTIGQIAAGQIKIHPDESKPADAYRPPGRY
jgi:hypothetical protein